MIFDRRILIEDLALQLDHKALLGLLGYRRGRTVLNESAQGLLESCLAEAEPLLHPRGLYRARRIERLDEGRFQVLGSSIRLEGRAMERLLGDAFGLVFLAVTIGPDLEERIARHQAEGRAERAVILDVIGSEAAEAAAVSLNSLVATAARQGKWALTRRFSPGYADLSLDLQAALDEELGLSDIGVTVTDRFMLLPQKSITALIGLTE